MMSPRTTGERLETVSGTTGFLLVDKAKGPTSHDVVQAVRALSGQRRCGHTGTLDPMATGLLPLCLGRATRLARFVANDSKAYSAVIRFGYATDTYDATGRLVGPKVEAKLTPEVLNRLLPDFIGSQEQVPPAFAAKKIQGQRMYRLARAGVEVKPRPVRVVIHRIDLRDVQVDRAALIVEVGAGTYIRSLAHDIGQRLGCGAHLEELRRLRVGPFSVEQALSLEQVEMIARAGRLGEAIWDPSRALSHLPVLRLGTDGAARVRHGMTVSALEIAGEVPDVLPGRPCRLLDPRGELLGVGVAVEGLSQFRPLVVLASPRRAPSRSSGSGKAF
jgi:tRNA pseudouridine55 synthase